MRVPETPRRSNILERATLVLNRSWLPVHVTTVRRALCMVFRETARIVCHDSLATYSFAEWLQQPAPDSEVAVRSPSVRVAAPEVVLLTRYNRVPGHQAPFSRRSLFLRDDYTCQYCGRQWPTDRLSVDHIHPRSRGGDTTWENCVLACIACNSRKANQTLREAGLSLLRKPVRPRWSPFLNMRPGQRMASWTQFSPEPRRTTNHN